METLEITVHQLASLLSNGDRPVLLDVRLPHEHQHCALEGSVLIPLHALPGRVEELDPAKQTVVYCHHGIRSLQATYFLRHAGFSQVVSLSGGVEAWAAEVDPNFPRY